MVKQYGCFKLVHFSKISGRLSSVGTKILAFGSRSLANFQLIFDCFIPNFELKYKDSENIKADRINSIILNLHQIKRQAFFGDTQQLAT